ncbi:glycosyltransferase [Citreicella sp. C3M06]|uniref:glycosyltransferase family 2 protein n=1 Tax=Citreicella sp. C3M06 TaxID=2841564 RepID=UPI001C0A65B2|nr:glycosyltransferase [Citreicella sp. C3M06]
MSVLLPVFNSEKFLSQALTSLSAQSFADFEVIAIDDGSTDRSGDMLAAHAAADPRFHVTRRENRGLIATLNEAIAMAQGRFLARMDADDICFPSRFKAQLAAFAVDPGLAICGTNFVTMHANGRVSRAGADILSEPRDLAIASRFFTSLRHPTIMIDREAMGDQLHYDNAYPCAEDFDLFRRVAEQGRLRQLVEPQLAYRLHPGSVSRLRARTMTQSHVGILEENLRRFYPQASGTGIDNLVDAPGPQTAALGADLICRLARLAPAQPETERPAFDLARRTIFYFLYSHMMFNGKIANVAAFLDGCDGWSLVRRREWPLIKAAPMLSGLCDSAYRRVRQIDDIGSFLKTCPAVDLVPGFNQTLSSAPEV